MFYFNYNKGVEGSRGRGVEGSRIEVQEIRLFVFSWVFPPVRTKPPICGHSSFRDMDSIGKNTSVYSGTPTTVIKKAFLH
jgi:hypothetical protein